MNTLQILMILPLAFAEDCASWEQNQYGVPSCPSYFGSGLYDQVGYGDELYRVRSIYAEDARGIGIIEHFFEVAEVDLPEGWSEMTRNEKAYAVKAKQSEFLANGFMIDVRDVSDPGTNYSLWGDIFQLPEGEDLDWHQDP